MLARGRRMGIGHDITRIEQGDPAHLHRSSKVAVIASWSAASEQSRSLSTFAAELTTAGFAVAVVSSCEAPEVLRWTSPIPADVVVARRPNHGYDFGSWSTALRTWPEITELDSVLLVNDSLLGPFAPLDHVLLSYARSKADMWGLTSSRQHGYHLQSFFLGFRGGLLAQPPLLGFWSQVRHHEDKRRVIRHGELGLSRLVRSEGYALEALLPSAALVHSEGNPSVHGWKRMLDSGVPMVKRELLTNPSITRDGHRVPLEIMARYGVDVRDWM